MRTEPFAQAPPPLMVLATLLSLFMFVNREASVQEDLPSFLPVTEAPVYLELSGGGLVSGVYQFSDGSATASVKILTDNLFLDNTPSAKEDTKRFFTGERLHIVKKEQRIGVLQKGWMPASHRMALSIPLHPDQMSEEDWRALPGIGAVLAERIEHNRQKFGEFGRLEALIRVRGIGRKRIESWQKFF